MAEKKISDLLLDNPAAALDGTEGFHAKQGPDSVGATIQQVRDFVLASPLVVGYEDNVGAYAGLTLLHDADSGGGFFVKKDGSDPFIVASGFESAGGAITLYFGGGSWGVRDANAIRFYTDPVAGSAINEGVERLRIGIDGHVSVTAGALLVGGTTTANTAINSSRHPVLRSYTVATLPSATQVGQLIYVSDGTSNKRLAVSDGTNWRFPDGNIVS